MKKHFAIAGLTALFLAASAVSTTAAADPLIEANVLSRKNGDRTEERSNRDELRRDRIEDARDNDVRSSRVSRNDTRSDKEFKRDQERARDRLADRQKDERELRDRRDD